MIHCYSGLCNRITALVHGLLNYKSFDFAWAKNPHLDLGHSELFSNIPGVRFVDVKTHEVSTIGGMKAWTYPKGYLDSEVLKNYNLVLKNLIYSEEPKRAKMSVHARYWYKHLSYSVEPFALAMRAIQEARNMGESTIALYSDYNRELLKNLFNGAGINVIMPDSPEMTHDNDRGDVLNFVKDWQSMLKSEVIITGAKCSSMIHPLLCSEKKLIRLKK